MIYALMWVVIVLLVCFGVRLMKSANAWREIAMIHKDTIEVHKLTIDAKDKSIETLKEVSFLAAESLRKTLQKPGDPADWWKGD